MELTPKERAARKAQVDEVLGQRLSDMSVRRVQEIVLIVAPVALLAGALVWLALQFVQPAPPKTLTIATGGTSGGYYAFGQKYAATLARNGIRLNVRSTAGSIENVKLLADANAGVDVALLQGGITNKKETWGLVSLGRVFLEPLWVFYRGGETIDRLSQLKGRRLAVGPPGSGTRQLAMTLLHENEISERNATLLPISGKAAADALRDGDVDAVFLVFAPEAPLVQTLIRSSDVRLMNFAQAEGYTRRFPFLERIVLPRGAIDLVRDVPAGDVAMVAPVAAVVAREKLHPALAGLLVDAMREAHDGGGLFHRIGDFPKPRDPEFDMADNVGRYYTSGPSFLKRHLPFWLATFIERMIVIAVPLAGALVPLARIGPVLYRWRVRRRLFYWYGRLKALEATVATDRSAESLNTYRAEVARIEDAVSTIPVPVGFAEEYYNLRAAIELVQQRLYQRAVVANASMG
ncbi:MAG: TAXI family TRAP transporter solute-binding subunit [Hyphomicrobiaceae bacterium]